MKVFLYLGLYTTSILSAYGQTGSDSSYEKIISSYYEHYRNKEHFTAIQAAVFIPQSNNSSPAAIKTFAHGRVSDAHDAPPVDNQNLFEIGSITKSFTALLLLQLQVAGLLSLDDPLGKWLPQYSNWHAVTLRQLLNMTSGIPNYSEDPEFSKKMYANIGRVWSNQELLKYAHPERPLAKERSNLYEYSNSNYILAALVIEKVAQKSFSQQLKDKIINSTHGFTTTFYPVGDENPQEKEAIAARLVHGYYYDENTHKLHDTVQENLSWAAAAGGLVSTSAEVLHWVDLLYHGKLLPKAKQEQALTEMKTVVSTNTGKAIKSVSAADPLGFGLGVVAFYDATLKQKFWVYKGSTLGFRVVYLWQPCNNIITVVSINSKGGEGNSQYTEGDESTKLSLDLYKNILQQHPNLQCAL